MPWRDSQSERDACRPHSATQQRWTDVSCEWPAALQRLQPAEVELAIAVKRPAKVAPTKKSKSNFRFIDLFAGIGGFRIAFEAAGGKCVYSSEWDKSAVKTYFANFGDIPAGDITKERVEHIPDFDVSSAGFPC